MYMYAWFCVLHVQYMWAVMTGVLSQSYDHPRYDIQSHPPHLSEPIFILVTDENDCGLILLPVVEKSIHVVSTHCVCIHVFVGGAHVCVCMCVGGCRCVCNVLYG